MTATEVLEQLGQLGVEAWPHGENIRLQPSSKVTPEIRTQVKEHKPEILALLSERRGDGQQPLSDRPPATEQELRRLIDHLADPAVFSQWLEWAINYTDPAEMAR